MIVLEYLFCFGDGTASREGRPDRRFLTTPRKYPTLIPSIIIIFLSSGGWGKITK